MQRLLVDDLEAIAFPERVQELAHIVETGWGYPELQRNRFGQLGLLIRADAWVVRQPGRSMTIDEVDGEQDRSQENPKGRVDTRTNHPDHDRNSDCFKC